MEISIEHLKKIEKDTYVLIDIREKEEALKNPIQKALLGSLTLHILYYLTQSP